MKKILCFIILFLICSQNTFAEGIKVAVASNFAVTIKKIVKVYEESSGNKVSIILGSTGKLYAQIKHGAPFDIFLAADTLRPQLLEKENIAVDESRFTYAMGQLVLWYPGKSLDPFSIDELRKLNFDKLSIANPKLAPYGRAAKQVLDHIGIFDKIKYRTVRGENIGQAYQYIESGNAQMGFVSLAHVIDRQNTNSYWKVPSEYYSPIKQQAVLLNSKNETIEFYDFLKSETSKKIIQKFGYKTQ